jgi:ferritin-like metal-binding protein YciE
LETSAEAKIGSGAADPNETPRDRRKREAGEKVDQIFDKILDGIETKREEALEWLIELGDELIDDVHDKADTLVKSL